MNLFAIRLTDSFEAERQIVGDGLFGGIHVVCVQFFKRTSWVEPLVFLASANGV